MRIGPGFIVIIAIASVILMLAFFASLVGSFMRETTGIDERWGGSVAARQGLADSIIRAGEGQDDNVPTNRPVAPALPGDGDYDGDGLLNWEETGTGSIYGLQTNGTDSDKDGFPDDIERTLGTDPNNPADFPGVGRTDPDNPDTDGDGMGDRTEISRGTNPNDPNDGGTAPPAKPEEPVVERGKLVLEKVVKAVKEPGSTAWAHFVEVPVGTSVDMWIHIEVQNKDTLMRTIIIEDHLSNGLAYSSGGTYKGIDGESTRPLPDNWLDIPHEINLVAGSTRVIDITFPVTAAVAGLEYNSVIVYDKNNISNSLGDKVFVTGQTAGASGNQSLDIGSIAFNQFNNEVKRDDQTVFSESAISSIGETVDFRIIIEVTNSYLTSRSLLLTDSLPEQLRYLDGQGNLGDLFRDGYLRMSVDPGRQQFIYNFSATVVSEVSETVYNTAKVYESKFAPNGAIDQAEVVIR